MTDRELLELAAKAASIEISWERNRGKMVARQQSDGYCGIFDPLNDNYAAMSLSVKLRLSIEHSRDATVKVWWHRDGKSGRVKVASTDATREAATRRAIVRAAADIGGSADNG